MENSRKEIKLISQLLKSILTQNILIKNMTLTLKSGPILNQ